MKYMLLIYTDEQVWTEAEREQCYGEATELAHTLKSNGQYLAASPLQPVSTATSIRVREGKRLVIDGPFMETREQLGGYFLIEVKDLDRGCRTNPRGPQGHCANPAAGGDSKPTEGLNTLFAEVSISALVRST
jgi:hypothetical protein